MALWKDVAGYEGKYLVSDEGEVMSLPRKFRKKAKILKPGKRGRGGTLYAFVILSDGKTAEHFAVHRLVANAFLDNPMMLPEINHKDENPLNNRVENLEWCSRQYNIEYSKAKRVAQSTMDGEKIAEYKSVSVASKMTGIYRTAINNALTGWSKTAGGYIWTYIEEE